MPFFDPLTFSKCPLGAANSKHWTENRLTLTTQQLGSIRWHCPSKPGQGKATSTHTGEQMYTSPPSSARPSHHLSPKQHPHCTRMACPSGYPVLPKRKEPGRGHSALDRALRMIPWSGSGTAVCISPYSSTGLWWADTGSIRFLGVAGQDSGQSKKGEQRISSPG